MGGTAGPATRTESSLTQANCRELSLPRDREGRLQPINGPTTGTNIIYEVGSGVGELGERTDTGMGSPS